MKNQKSPVSSRNIYAVFTFLKLSRNIYIKTIMFLYANTCSKPSKLCALCNFFYSGCSFPNVMQESKISGFHEGIGVCEQLLGIPIPLSYTRLTSRFLVLWHLTLPIILWDDCHWIVIPATFMSAASLFCIEEVCFASVCLIMHLIVFVYVC